jgi:hypothetical protein
MNPTRRHLLSTAPLLAVAGCSALATASTTATTATAATGTLAITTVQQATTFWGTIKGVAEVAIAGVSALDPALGSTLTAAIAVGDSVLAALPAVASDAEALASGIATLVQHGAALISQAGVNITAVSNGITG